MRDQEYLEYREYMMNKYNCGKTIEQSKEGYREYEEYVTIKSNDRELMELLRKEYSDNFYRLRIDKNDNINIVNMEGSTHLQLGKIAREMKDTLIIAQYKLEGEDCKRTYEYRYMNGRHFLSNVDIHYHITHSSEDMRLLE